jgi:hypothetical protein
MLAARLKAFHKLFDELEPELAVRTPSGKDGSMPCGRPSRHLRTTRISQWWSKALADGMSAFEKRDSSAGRLNMGAIHL